MAEQTSMRVFEEDLARQYDEFAPIIFEDFFAFHQVCQSVILEWIKARSTTRMCVLDLGCGTGFDAEDLLRQNDQLSYVGIDLSAGMLDLAKRRVAGTRQTERCVFIQADFREADLKEIVEGLPLAHELDLVVLASMSLHHCSYSEKARLFGNLYRMLSPEGLFINGDIFRYNSEYYENYSYQAEISGIRRRFGAILDGEVGERRTELMGLAEHWIHHYQFENRPLTLDEETAILRSAHFKTIECVYRAKHTGILVAAPEEL